MCKGAPRTVPNSESETLNPKPLTVPNSESQRTLSPKSEGHGEPTPSQTFIARLGVLDLNL